MAIRYKYKVTITQYILAEDDQDAIDKVKYARSIDAVYEVERFRSKWWKKRNRQQKGCQTCIYYNKGCSRYVMNPDLLKHPEECGIDGHSPHWEWNNKLEPNTQSILNRLLNFMRD